MSGKFKSKLLRAAAEQAGGVLRIDKRHIDTQCDMVMMEDDRDNECFIIRSVQDSDVQSWPENENRIGVIGQNGNNGDHYDSE